jgi:hypothetical protein
VTSLPAARRQRLLGTRMSFIVRPLREASK